MYGGIHEIAFSKCDYQKGGKPHTAEALVDIYVKDSVNGDGRYVQQFFLEELGGQWRIRRISLLQTDRAEKGWNLKLVTQPGLEEKDIKKLLRPVYDTASQLTSDGEAFDKLERTIAEARFFQTPDGIYAAVVVQNGCEYCAAAYTGWCDVFVFKQNGQQWKMTDFKLHAGGGGMYGNSGHAEKPLLRTGTHIVGLVITGGWYHMGVSYGFDNILAIEKGRISDLTSVTTDYNTENIGNGSPACQENSYRFIPSGKLHYDLQLIQTNCLGKDKETGRVIVPYLQNDYAIPADYIFEM